jgi:hydroxyacylglutathione hydrolase
MKETNTNHNKGGDFLTSNGRWGPIHFIPGPNRGKYPHCHSLYIEGGSRVVIDPASDPKTLADLADGPGVDMVWLSHAHEDHLMFLDLFNGRPLWVSEPDAPPLADLDVFIDYYGVTDEGERRFWKETMVRDFNYRPRQVDRFLDRERTIDLGGVRVEVISTPGHTPGHCAFFFPDQALLFLGDYDLTKFGPWYGDRYSSIDETIASLERLRQVPAEVWITGHEDGVFESDPGDLWDRYADVIRQRESKLLDLLKEKPRTLEEVIEAHIIYRKAREPKEFYDFGERGHMVKHLERLIRQGLVTLDKGLYDLTG